MCVFFSFTETVLRASCLQNASRCSVYSHYSWINYVKLRQIRLLAVWQILRCNKKIHMQQMLWIGFMPCGLKKRKEQNHRKTSAQKFDQIESHQPWAFRTHTFLFHHLLKINEVLSSADPQVHYLKEQISRKLNTMPTYSKCSLSISEDILLWFVTGAMRLIDVCIATSWAFNLKGIHNNIYKSIYE